MGPPPPQSQPMGSKLRTPGIEFGWVFSMISQPSLYGRDMPSRSTGHNIVEHMCSICSSNCDLSLVVIRKIIYVIICAVCYTHTYTHVAYILYAKCFLHTSSNSILPITLWGEYYTQLTDKQMKETNWMGKLPNITQLLNGRAGTQILVIGSEVHDHRPLWHPVFYSPYVWLFHRPFGKRLLSGYYMLFPPGQWAASSGGQYNAVVRKVLSRARHSAQV